MQISEMNLFLRACVELPDGVKAPAKEFREGWNLVRTASAKRLERRIQTRGWHFDKTNDGLPGSGVGDTAEDAIAAAFKLTLRRVSEYFNAVEVAYIEITKYPWFFLARVRVRSGRIQESAMTAVADDAPTVPATLRPRRLPERAAALFPEFGSAMPVLKQMLTANRATEARPQ